LVSYGRREIPLASDSSGRKRLRVETESRPNLFDPDLDPPRRAPPFRLFDSMSSYQRLIVNPFLAVLGWLAAFALIRFSIRIDNLPLFGTAVLGLFIPFYLIQFHCLDCGETGWYRHARSHACAAVVVRRDRGERERFRGPGIKTQLMIWLYVLLAGLILYFMVFRTRH
jgi:hypothetical protein